MKDFKKNTAGLMALLLFASLFFNYETQKANADVWDSLQNTIRGGVSGAAECAVDAARGKAKSWAADKLGLGSIFEESNNNSGSQDLNLGASSVPVSDADVLDAQEEAVGIEKERECMDKVAYETSRTAMSELNRDTIDFIIGAGDENPLFITNYRQHFNRLQEAETLNFLDELENGGNLPFGDITANILRKKTLDPLKSTMSLDEIQSFENNFSGNGQTSPWNSFIEYSSNPKNNAVGSALNSMQELGKRSHSRVQEERDRLGGEMLPQTSDCQAPVNVSGSDVCLEDQITTPGSGIGAILNTTLTSSIRQAEMSDGRNTFVDDLFDEFFNDALDGLFQDGTPAIASQSGSRSSQFGSSDSQWNPRERREEDLEVLALLTGGDDILDEDDFAEIDFAEDDPEIDDQSLVSEEREEINLIARARKYIDLISETREIIGGDRSSTSHGGILADLIELDQSLPQPEFGWEERAREKIRQETQILSELTSDREEMLETLENFNLLGVGRIAGAINSVFGDSRSFRLLLANDDDDLVRAFPILGHAFPGGKGYDYNDYSGEDKDMVHHSVLPDDYLYGNAPVRGSHVDDVKRYWSNAAEHLGELEMQRINFDIQNHNLPSAGVATDDISRINEIDQMISNYDQAINDVSTVLRSLETIRDRLRDSPSEDEKNVQERIFLRHLDRGELIMENDLEEAELVQFDYEGFATKIKELQDQINEELQLSPFAGIDNPPVNPYSVYRNQSDPANPATNPFEGLGVNPLLEAYENPNY